MDMFLHGYTAYKELIGGASIGAMVVMDVQLWYRLPNMPEDQRPAYKMWAVYLAAGAVLTSIIMLGYVFGTGK